MKKILLLSLPLFIYGAVSAQVIPDKDQWTCQGVHENLYSQLNAGKVVVVAMQGIDCTGCIGNAPYVDSFATNNKAKVRVWSALQLMAGSGGTCTQVDNWIQTNGYNDVFAFLDSSNYWITNNPGAEWLVIDPADKQIKYKGYDRDKAFVEARKIFDPVSVNELPRKQNISLYPNPTSDAITFSLNADANIKVMTVSGKEVVNINERKGSVSVDVHNLPAGTYFLTVINHDGIKAGQARFIKY